VFGQNIHNHSRNHT